MEWEVRRANVRDGKRHRLSVADPLEKYYIPDAVNTSENAGSEKESEDKPQERDLLAEICEVKEKLSLSKFALERFSSNDDDIFFLHRISVLQSLHRIRELCQNECLVAT